MIIQKSKRMRELVYDQLKALVIDGTLQPGSRIIETDYAEKFQISRTPIREAIRMLELEGLVESQSKGGVTVTGINKLDIDEIYKIRIALEEVILKEVILQANSDGIQKLDDLMKETKNLLNDENRMNDVFDLFSSFNDLLYEIAKLNRVTEMIKNLNFYMKRFRKMAIDSGARKEIAFQDHKAIVEAIKEKNIIKTLKLNKMHLERSRNFIINILLK
ncbi:GntR family transcriptional regulator [Psychrilyobacter sp.]|uniref:GntR family transcriptional regulator n=1 Tax=Psychrilyobacter sp. TaxID=2586924 RepID=UPI00301A91C5